MKFKHFSLGKEDFKYFVYVFVGIYIWTQTIVPAFDETFFTPGQAYVIYNAGLLAGAYYLGHRLDLGRQTLGVISLIVARDILDFPFCPLWTTAELPSSQIVAHDCALKWLFMDTFGWSYYVSHQLTYVLVPGLLVILGFALVTHKRISVIFNGRTHTRMKR